jgi:hypothetical protein
MPGRYPSLKNATMPHHQHIPVAGDLIIMITESKFTKDNSIPKIGVTLRNHSLEAIVFHELAFSDHDSSVSIFSSLSHADVRKRHRNAALSTHEDSHSPDP